MTEPHAFTIVAVIFPNVTQLDFTGPAQVLGRIPGAKMQVAWHRIEPVPTDSGFAILPSTTFAAAPQADLLLVPGGPGSFDLLADREAIDFIRRQGESAQWVTSVCTGSFPLAAAGLLDGYRATTHWASKSLLASQYGIDVADGRVVIDRNRITGGGVTAGIDFGLTIVAMLAGEELAKSIQLTLEYDPQPPFDAGNPANHDPAEIARRIAAVESHRAKYFPTAADRA